MRGVGHTVACLAGRTASVAILLGGVLLALNGGTHVAHNVSRRCAGAWPLLIDDFVVFVRKLQAAGGAPDAGAGAAGPK